jgi:hypothetical protein
MPTFFVDDETFALRMGHQTTPDKAMLPLPTSKQSQRNLRMFETMHIRETTKPENKKVPRRATITCVWVVVYANDPKLKDAMQSTILTNQLVLPQVLRLQMPALLK